MAILTAGNKYLLDTTVFINAKRNIGTARQLIFEARTPTIAAGYSIITEAELWFGIRSNNLRTEAEHKILLRPFRRYFVNVAIARRAGLMAGAIHQKTNKRILPDCVIAATAEYYGLIVCTRNTVDFTELSKEFGIQYLAY